MKTTAKDILLKFRQFARHNDNDMRVNDDLTINDYREYDQEQLDEASQSLYQAILALPEMQELNDKNWDANWRNGHNQAVLKLIPALKDFFGVES